MEIKGSLLKSEEAPNESGTPLTRIGDLGWQEASLRCTHCGATNATNAMICGICQLSLKFEDRQHWYPSKDLLKKWFSVRSHYDDNLQHLGFVEACLNSENVVFGLNQYRRILQVSPHEPTAKAMTEILLSPIMVSVMPPGKSVLPSRSMVFSLAYGVCGFILGLGLVLFDLDLMIFAALFLLAVAFVRSRLFGLTRHRG